MVITALYIAMVATDVASRSPSKGIAQGDHNAAVLRNYTASSGIHIRTTWYGNSTPSPSSSKKNLLKNLLN